MKTLAANRKSTSMKTNDKIAIVTGAAGGFGSQVVQQLLSDGFCVAATDVSEQGLNHLANCVGNAERLGLFHMDVCDLQSIQHTSEKVTHLFGDCIYVLVNNAGIFENTPILSLMHYQDKVRKIIDTNLIGACYCTSFFSKLMIRHRVGRIVNIASMAGIMGAASASAYAASKAGMIAATKSWARELGPFGISVNTVTPGVCRTDMLKRAETENAFSSEEEKMLLQFIPARRLGTSKDVAELVAFLSTCKTDYINGAVIELDGGLNTGSVEAV
jgi:3-oxoacyl-[acyl-carrier protein] reductase